MTVLAQTFNIMLPDKATLFADITDDRDKLLKIYRDRELADIAEAECEAQVMDSQLPKEL